MTLNEALQKAEDFEDRGTQVVVTINGINWVFAKNNYKGDSLVESTKTKNTGGRKRAGTHKEAN